MFRLVYSELLVIILFEVGKEVTSNISGRRWGEGEEGWGGVAEEGRRGG